MKTIICLLLSMPLVAGVSEANVEVLNSVPAGFKLQNFRFIYDKQACGPINFVLNEKNGDCSVEFENFYSLGSQERSCDLTIEVDLPPGLAMTPSRLSVQGDYQFDSGGTVDLKADYTLEGAENKIVLQRHWSNTDAGPISNSFLEEERWTAPQPFSPCGGTAVFHGRFTLSSSTAPEQKQSLLDIGKTNQGAMSDKTAPVAYWGWDYQVCQR